MKIAIRVCSPQKTNMEQGFLWEIYYNPMLQAFFKSCRKNSVPFFVLSRKYGLCDGKMRWMNYSDEEEQNDEKLLSILISQHPRNKDLHFVYWNHRPLTHTKWVKMLQKAGFQVDQARDLKELIKKCIGGKYLSQLSMKSLVIN
ncbi:hypothetical protein [Candidatus Lokiarchaeum ossiferum]|uniref:hypothetical protein n=1 Tax=Candidatus Lokiarchaeum ossiferum TaxID=2951803 RepID=UPI00352BE3D1